jgi:Kef-type K+ transport system membrane component KefB
MTKLLAAVIVGTVIVAASAIASAQPAPPDAAIADAAVPPDATVARSPRDARVRDAGASQDGDAGPPLDAHVDADPNPDADLPDAEPIGSARPNIGNAAIPADEPVLPPPHIENASERTVFAIKVIAGLIILVVLAYLGGHRRVVALEARLGIASLVTAGFPFVALGLFASHPGVAILDDQVVQQLRPVLQFGLGWLGFLIGAQLDIRILDRVPQGTAYMIVIEALAPFVVTAAACGGVMLAFGASWRDPTFWRDAILLGTAAAMTAPRRYRGFANRSWNERRGADVLMSQLDEIVGVVGLLFITAYFRETGSGTWALPATAWLFISIGLGVVVGVLILVMVRVPRSRAEFLAVVLGAIAFASGLAGYLGLSPIVVCFLAGALLTNFPCDQRASVFEILAHLERPVQLVFLIIAGAIWTVTDWRGWLLVPVFVAARIAGKWIGIMSARSAVDHTVPSGFVDRRLLVSPMSSLSIALVVSVQSTMVDPGRLPWIVTAVIGAAVASELVVQIIDPMPASGSASALDELDDGPVYLDDEAHDLDHDDDGETGGRR